MSGSVYISFPFLYEIKMIELQFWAKLFSNTAMSGTAKKELPHTGVKYKYCSILLHFSRSVD
jgi:hypothetical protein